MKRILYVTSGLLFSLIANSQTPTLQNVTDAGSSTTKMIGTPGLLSNASAGTLTLIGGATGVDSYRGGQIKLYGGSNTNAPSIITFHTGVEGSGAEQLERMRLSATG